MYPTLTPTEAKTVEPFARKWLDHHRLCQKHTHSYLSRKPELGYFTVRPAYPSEGYAIYNLQFDSAFKRALIREYTTIEKQLKLSMADIKDYGAGFFVLVNPQKEMIGYVRGSHAADTEKLPEFKEHDVELSQAKLIEAYHHLKLSPLFIQHALPLIFDKNSDAVIHITVKETNDVMRGILEKTGFKLEDKHVVTQCQIGCMSTEKLPYVLDHMTLTLEDFTKSNTMNASSVS
jgi:hypothetical protein